jgi:hypothetical protein
LDATLPCCTAPHFAYVAERVASCSRAILLTRSFSFQSTVRYLWNVAKYGATKFSSTNGVDYYATLFAFELVAFVMCAMTQQPAAYKQPTNLTVLQVAFGCAADLLARELCGERGQGTHCLVDRSLISAVHLHVRPPSPSRTSAALHFCNLTVLQAFWPFGLRATIILHASCPAHRSGAGMVPAVPHVPQRQLCHFKRNVWRGFSMERAVPAGQMFVSAPPRCVSRAIFVPGLTFSHCLQTFS